ncbi:MAG: XdhC family protein [Hyphomicrobiales bacterium]|nr:MAG: XdhC family protein [Hyphomicrobiales bacterium]
MLEIATTAPPRDTFLDPDDPASVFRLLESGSREGLSGALLTIVETKGGGPRALGAQMAVLEDGRYCGYISGGCVEAAVAAEAIRCIRAGAGERMRFGAGSLFLDIELPCGGSLDVQVSVRPDLQIVERALRLIEARTPFCLAIGLRDEIELILDAGATERTHMRAGRLLRHYHPLTRLVLVGEGNELVALARAALSAGLSVASFLTADTHRGIVDDLGAPATLITGADLPTLPVDPFTAIVIVMHDRFKESRLLEDILSYEPFYLGAVGSQRTHAQRLERLGAAGMPVERLSHLRGPIGLFGPARTSSSLAISVLAEILEARMQLDG